ncbi:hypothetical protein GCM10010399_60810 [Dactylosporangium fulvum]
MLVVNLVDALRHPDRWSGFVAMLSVVALVTGVMSLVFHALRQKRR